MAGSDEKRAKIIAAQAAREAAEKLAGKHTPSPKARSSTSSPFGRGPGRGFRGRPKAPPTDGPK